MKLACARCAILMVLPMAAFAQAPAKKPDFSGSWQLDLDRTRFAGTTRPDSLVIQIEHHEPAIRLTMVTDGKGGHTTDTMDLTTDGAEHPVTLHGQPCTATARWDAYNGKRLVVEVKQTPSGNTLFIRRFTHGSKGKIMTTVFTTKDGATEKKIYEFFVKRGA